jgi:hypothetical protein
MAIPDAPQLPLKFLTGEFSIHSLSSRHAIPQQACEGELFCVVKTAKEVTLICPTAVAVEAKQSSDGWCVLQVLGPLDFNLTGILAGIAASLAKAGISIFAVSSWETDYILLRAHEREEARMALEQCGHVFATSDPGQCQSTAT